MTKTFVSKWVLNSRTGQPEPEIDEIRSVYPYTLASGYQAWGAGSTANTSILAVPSATRFHLKWLWINNDNDATNQVAFYDGPGTSVPVGKVIVAGSTTEFIPIGQGVVFASAVHGSNLTSNIQVRVGGILLESGPE